MDIKIVNTTTPKTKPDYSKLGFGQYFTDHMFMIDHTDELGWHDARIVPYGPLDLDPAAMVFHYAFEYFEGMKAYHCQDGKVRLFRPYANAARMNTSADGLCMPPLPEEDFVKAVTALVRVDKDWIPTAPGTALYIRPFTIATEPALGVRKANAHRFIIILSPVGSYYSGGLAPVKIHVEDTFVRAVKGGTGAIKCGGNYAASIKAQVKAKEKGYAQVLYLDGVEKTFVEEVGAMNVMFQIGDEVVTPPLCGTILPGITRDSCLQLLKSWGVKVSERPIGVQELFDAAKEGTFKEMFGTGTAAVISPVGELGYKGEDILINNGEIGSLSQRLYDTLTGIQCGRIEDPFGWTVVVED